MHPTPVRLHFQRRSETSVVTTKPTMTAPELHGLLRLLDGSWLGEVDPRNAVCTDVKLLER